MLLPNDEWLNQASIDQILRHHYDALTKIYEKTGSLQIRGLRIGLTKKSPSAFGDVSWDSSRPLSLSSLYFFLFLLCTTHSASPHFAENQHLVLLVKATIYPPALYPTFPSNYLIFHRQIPSIIVFPPLRAQLTPPFNITTTVDLVLPLLFPLLPHQPWHR